MSSLGSKVALAAAWLAACSSPATPLAEDQLAVVVPASGRVYVNLTTRAIVTPADPRTDLGWDLAFEGYELFTNGGASGSGGGGAFGPLDAVVFLGDTAPDVPFITPDALESPFERWFLYTGPPNHVLDSRFHVFGVRSGSQSFAVQILGYYGNVGGVPTSGIYSLRWAQLTPTGPSSMRELSDLDGRQATPDAATDCIALATGTRTRLTPAAALTSGDWDLCFRQQQVSVDGDAGGPGGIGAVDLDADETATETLAIVDARTPSSEQARFDSVTESDLAGRQLHGDHVTSAFADLWLEPGTVPTPAHSAWLVVGADGTHRTLVGFVRFEGASETGPGTIILRTKPVS